MADGSAERRCGFQGAWHFSGIDVAPRATAEHSRVKVRSRRCTTFHEQEPFSAVDHCAECSAAFVVDTVFGHDVESDWIAWLLRQAKINEQRAGALIAGDADHLLVGDATDDCDANSLEPISKLRMAVDHL
jgi:hypothetical protein